MTDLISRQAAIDGKIPIQLANGVEIYSDEAVPVEYLKRLPSAKPVRHGKWIFESIRGHAVMTCSECCKVQDGQTLCFAYCPNCGAKMDEE